MRLLAEVPAEHADTGAGTVVRVDLGRSQWALAVQPPGTPAPPATQPGDARPAISSVPSRFALIREPGPVDPVLGLAVLLYRRGHTLICCPANHITDRAAAVLSALAAQEIPAVAGCHTVAPAGPGPRVTFTRVEHSLRPGGRRHVASPLVRGCDITFMVCSRLISAELADVLGLLCTAYARDLLELGRPRAEILAASGR